MNHPERHELYDVPNQKKLQEEIVQKLPNAYTYIINKEDHTLGNVIRCQLVKDPKVMFAGYRMPHPLEHHIEIKLRTTDVTPRDALLKSIDSVKTELQFLKAQFKSQIPSQPQNGNWEE